MRLPNLNRKLSLVAIAATLALVMSTGVSQVFAVHNLDFCLQGDVGKSVTANGITCAAGQIDWKDILSGGATYTSGTTTLSTNAVQPNPSPLLLTKTNGTFIASTATPDFASGTTTPDPTTFSTGSKDTNPISTGNNPWQCASSNNVGAKVNLLDTYGAVEYVNNQQDWNPIGSGTTPTQKTGSTSTHTLLYWGAEIESANGNHNQGIWLLQDKNVACATGGTQTFSGNHVDGDLLFTVALTGGGSKPLSASVIVFRWTGDATTGTMTQLGGGTNIGSVCGSGSGATDLACAITNATANVSVPWSIADGSNSGGTLGPQQFFEGGIDVTAVQQLFGQPTPCFTKYLTDTRSSQSDTSTLFDFTNAQLNTCVTPSVSTQLKVQSGASQSNTDSNAPVPPATIGVGTKVYDTSTLGAPVIGTPGGTVTYKLFANNDCTGAVASADIGGATLGSDGTLNDIVSGPSNVSSTTMPNSSSLTFTQAGKTFYWVAYYSGDGINLKSNSGCAAEPIKVGPLSPTMSTAANNPTSPYPLIVGQAASVGDTATLKGAYFKTANTSIGTISFTLYGPAAVDGSGNVTSCGSSVASISGVAVTSATTGTVSSLDVSSGTTSFTPASAGDYYWTAAFTPSDGNNNTVTHAGCVVGTPGSLDSSEKVSAIKATPKLTTLMFVGDTATLSGGYGTLTGSLTFKLYKDLATSTTVCGGTPVATYTATLGTPNTTGDLASNLASYQMAAGYVYNWSVTFTDTDGSNNSVTVGCGSSTGATGSTTTEQATPTYAP